MPDPTPTPTPTHPALLLTCNETTRPRDRLFALSKCCLYQNWKSALHSCPIHNLRLSLFSPSNITAYLMNVHFDYWLTPGLPWNDGGNWQPFNPRYHSSIIHFSAHSPGRQSIQERHFFLFLKRVYTKYHTQVFTAEQCAVTRLAWASVIRIPPHPIIKLADYSTMLASLVFD